MKIRKLNDIPFRSKEVSWLSFNSRVLQEAQNPAHPILERIRFLGIYSSNLDEFFRIRVATLKRLVKIGNLYTKLNIPNPKETLVEVIAHIAKEGVLFNETYDLAIKDLRTAGIRVVDDQNVPKELRDEVADYFKDKVLPRIMPIMTKTTIHLYELGDQPMYLAVRMSRKSGGRPAHAILEIPSDKLPRFRMLSEHKGERFVMFLDDIIRFGLPRVFASLNYDTFESYAIKFTRDAEIELDDDITESFYEKLTDAISARQSGAAVRLNYDASIPPEVLRLLRKRLNISGDDTLYPGARYHNRRDLMSFPSNGDPSLEYPRFLPSPHPVLCGSNGHLFAIIKKKDQLIHTPYQHFGSFLDLLREAAIDPLVRSIKLTQYRLAKKSCIAHALISAVRSGKKVTVCVEPTARFDEQANITYASLYQSSGIKVILGMPGLKVHAKLCLISRMEGGREKRYSAIATGNFNEDTARIYGDHMLLTADPEFGNDVNKIFGFFKDTYRPPKLTHLICSPFGLRPALESLFLDEIKNAENGKTARITLKMNNLSDPHIIDLLYKASRAGVKVRLIVRSMFSVVTEQEGFSENIEAISIVDRFLEHTRIYIFENDGEPKVFITSADCLPRNLDGRVEVTCPILHKSLKKQLIDYVDFQWRDSNQARRLDAHLTNQTSQSEDPLPDSTPTSQRAIAQYLRDLK